MKDYLRFFRISQNENFEFPIPFGRPSAGGNANLSILYETSVFILLLAILPLLMISVVTDSKVAMAHGSSISTTNIAIYSCGDLTGNHCFGAAK